MFDSSVARGKPSTFPLDKSLPGWRECVQLMTVGEKRRCWVPESLAYKGAANRPKGTVVFDIALLDARSSPLVPPADVKAPPADAHRTASGLAYKVLRPGTGTRHPSSFSNVVVHYTGWTTDGKMFDSSVARGMPATMSLESVIRGWTEGVQLMAEGERTRFWIPQDLAYKGEAGQPKGMLVFDIELIRIQ
jgi:peptidylprolyl isomerase